MPKTILVLIDEDYEPATEGATAFDDVVNALEFLNIPGETYEIDLLPEQAKKFCRDAGEITEVLVQAHEVIGNALVMGLFPAAARNKVEALAKRMLNLITSEEAENNGQES